MSCQAMSSQVRSGHIILSQDMERPGYVMSGQIKSCQDISNKVCSRCADVPIGIICTFIAFSWISHVLCLSESRTIMLDKGSDKVWPCMVSSP